ncbi:unnamed protein product [Didymodactylos carnosus]|uniref:Blue (type 1) copper domain-containing protein n=1 Tax=Didymodactylos carnosus TaxID=1234261 RepID=A0A814M0E8_9BILA|nr:unnamed protein product [Didymodactylos carnosus]CAF3839699.1 unnamed protein product [Didymodactylos carnosus]
MTAKLPETQYDSEASHNVDLVVPKTHNVVVANYAFTPKILTIKSGDTVKWINKDFVNGIRHTVTRAVDGKSCKTRKAGTNNFDIDPLQGTLSKTFTKAEIIYYYCIPHCARFGHKGSIIVKSK